MNQLINTHEQLSDVVKGLFLALTVASPIVIAFLIMGQLTGLSVFNTKRGAIKCYSAAITSLIVGLLSAITIWTNGGIFTNEPYHKDSFLTARTVTLTDFNKVMEKEQGLKFQRISGNRERGIPNQYTVMDLNNKKTYYNCQLNFSSAGDKVLLNAVTCGNNILKTK